MRKNIKILGCILLIYGIYFNLIPFVNGIKSLGINIIKEAIFWNNTFQLIINLFCGVGLLRLNKIARLTWLVYCGYILLINVPEIQMLIQGKFLKFDDVPLYYWIKNYTLFILIIYSLIFLNLPKIKALFIRKS